MPSPGTRPVCVFLLQLGAPADIDGIEPFLRNLLEDVLPVPAWLRGFLARRIARRRAPRVAPLYREIGGGSPLLANTRAQAGALEAELRGRGIEARVEIAMRYAPPRATDALEVARREGADASLVVLPLYPQYSLTTTASSLTELHELLTTAEEARLAEINAYPTEPGYLEAMAECVREGLSRFPEGEQVSILFSAHSVPMSFVRKGDPYPDHVQQTVDGVVALLDGEPPWHLSFQSRLGPVKWLGPSTVDKTRELGAAGVENLLVVPVAFVSDHLETLHELDIELAATAREAGIARFERAPTVAARSTFIRCLADLVVRALPRDSVPPAIR